MLVLKGNSTTHERPSAEHYNLSIKATVLC